ncbi:MAG TPA: endonuclease/exonuclease/phosphatase family protein [Candidatus Limnocylindria bacterium]
MAPLTVLTWNLQGQAAEQVGLSAVLARHQPDLVFLQEADASALAAEPSNADWLAHSYTDGAAGSWPGMAILSRLPLRRASTLRLAPDIWDRPRILVASVAHARGELLAVCVHAKAPMPVPFLHAGPRNRQLADLTVWLAEQSAPGQQMVVAGDFNAVSWRLDGLLDAAEAVGSADATWRPIGVPWLPAVLRLDRVFVSPSIGVNSLTVACASSRSDHCPVIAEIELGDGRHYGPSLMMVSPPNTNGSSI